MNFFLKPVLFILAFLFFLIEAFTQHPKKIAIDESKPYEFEVFNEETSCTISNIQVEIYECAQTKSYNIKILFDINKRGSKGFSIYLEDERLYVSGNYEQYDSLGFIFVSSINCGAFGNNEITIVDNEFDTCRAVSPINEINDCGQLVCKIKNLELMPLECDTIGQFKMDVKFNHELGDAEGFSIFANEINIGSFKYSELDNKGFVTTKPIATDTTNYTITVSDNRRCKCESKHQIGKVSCTDLNCAIQNLTAVANTCIEMDSIKIDFDYQNTNNPLFDVYLDHEKLSTSFQLDDFPFQIHRNRKVEEVKIVQQDNPICFTRAAVEYPICNAVADAIQEAIKIYQSNGSVTISKPHKFNTIGIYDVAGRNMYSAFVSDSFVSIDTKILSKGLLLVRLQSDEDSIIKKVYIE